MKKLYGWVSLTFFAFFTFGISSCSDDDSQPEVDFPAELGQSTLDKGPNYETAAKYVVNGNSNYQSIELTEDGHYIISLNSEVGTLNTYSYKASDKKTKILGCLGGETTSRNVHFGRQINGTFVDLGGGMYILEGFGAITIEGDDDHAMSINISPNNGEPEELVCSKSDKIGDSQGTRWLCRTWSISEVGLTVSINGGIVYSNRVPYTSTIKMYTEGVNRIMEVEAAMFGESLDADDYVTEADIQSSGIYNVDVMTFTRAGTYLICANDVSMLGVSMWTWQDEDAGKIRYTHNYDNFYDPIYSNGIQVNFAGAAMNMTEVKEIKIDGDEDCPDVTISLVTRYFCHE